MTRQEFRHFSLSATGQRTPFRVWTPSIFRTEGGTFEEEVVFTRGRDESVRRVVTPRSSSWLNLRTRGPRVTLPLRLFGH